MLIYRFCLAYNIHVQELCKNTKANISLDNCVDIYCKFGYTQCNIFERETLHGNTTNYLSLLMGDAHNIRISHTPNTPPPDAALFSTGNPFQNCKSYFRKKFKYTLLSVPYQTEERSYNESISHLHLKNTSMFTPV